jgi:hypothetical protein
MLDPDLDLDLDSFLVSCSYCTLFAACALEVCDMTPVHALERSKVQLPVLKVREGASVEAVLCDVGPLWFGVHWVGGRQLLCSFDHEQDCPLCGMNQSRVIGMTIAVCRAQVASRAFLLQVSPLAFLTFEQRCEFLSFELSDGVFAQITRPRARGCLRIEPVKVVGLGDHWVDGYRRLLAAWAVLYGLPLPLVNETFKEFGTRVLSIVQARGRIADAASRK